MSCRAHIFKVSKFRDGQNHSFITDLSHSSNLKAVHSISSEQIQSINKISICPFRHINPFLSLLLKTSWFLGEVEMKSQNRNLSREIRVGVGSLAVWSITNYFRVWEEL